MTDRPTASTINDAQLDQLYDDLAAARAALVRNDAPPICELPHQTVVEEDACERERLAGMAPSCSPGTEETEPNNSTPPALREQLHAAIESEIYEYRERTMFWEECGGVTEEIARLATRGAMEVLAGQPVPAWTPPPPGSTREQLPDHLLALIADRLPDYTSTACQTADTLACAACYPGSGIPRPQYDEIREHAERLHERCRINQKFTGQLCACGCHPEQP